jgi:hypothetical protein
MSPGVLICTARLATRPLVEVGDDYTYSVSGTTFQPTLPRNACTNTKSNLMKMIG